ncbi:unnamed protein product (macronuclear) [Paramecium tetraurelia]|uniref:Uncharacterized protein n=1 Tax=Paramecium tetraurelia TaxID=5888 RepID=A0DDP1_PARTE|nr:uncharacterized protein GSPATT00015999001 [Paramecium tetraurelia]CAK81158.1 unnamed protein product [Paramecium tetraurelia]|eukprot:XP_001448555.1 hypothetical protein (macronuclear) [Paramecium tetraurelia strain d4-2]
MSSEINDQIKISYLKCLTENPTQFIPNPFIYPALDSSTENQEYQFSESFQFSFQQN